MANYSRTGTSVSTIQDIIDEIVDFVTSSGPGPGWSEDSTYASGTNPGKMFIRSAGATKAYIYGEAIEIIENASAEYAVDGLRFGLVPASSNGWGGAAGPSSYLAAQTSTLFMPAGFGYTLDLFADEKSLKIVLIQGKSTEHVIMAGEPVTFAQVLVIGLMTSHSDASDDPYPVAMLSNTGYGLPSDGKTVLGLSATEGHFPSTLVKWIGPDDVAWGAAYSGGDEWQSSCRPGFRAPENSRKGLAQFAYPLNVQVTVPGLGESFTVPGVYYTGTQTCRPYGTVTLSSADYAVYPTGPGARGDLLLAIPVGTTA